MEKSYCELCEISVPDLTLHMQWHKNKEARIENLKCPVCQKVFKKKFNRDRHLLLCGQRPPCEYQCEYCQKHFIRSDNLRQHKKICKKAPHNIQPTNDVNGENNQQSSQPDQNEPASSTSKTGPSLQNESEHESSIKRPNHVSEQNTDPNDWFCECCDIHVPANKRLQHFASTDHKDKALIQKEDNVYQIESCFGDRIVTYRLINDDPQNLDLFAFLNMKKNTLINLLTTYTEQHNTINFQLEITTQYAKKEPDGEITVVPIYIQNQYSDINLADINRKNYLENKIQDVFSQLNTTAQDIELRGSGFTMSEIFHVELHMNRKEVLSSGGTYIPLPRHIQNKKACINPKNNDNECFKRCIKAYFLDKELHQGIETKIANIKAKKQMPMNTQRNHIRKEYVKVWRRLEKMNRADEELVDSKYGISFEGVEYPMKLEEIEDFVDGNPTVNINVFGISVEDNKTIVGPLVATRRKVEHSINLLYITDDSGETGHYCLIKSLSRLVSRQRKNRRDKLYYCQICLLSFKSEEKLKTHGTQDCLGVVTCLPQPGRKLKFEAERKQLKAPFVVYADFECKLVPIHGCRNKNEKTRPKHLHVPSSFCYLIKSSFDSSLDCMELYRGDNSATTFARNLTRKVKDLYEEHVFNKYVPIQMTPQEEAEYDASTICHICKKEILDPNDKVRDHNHLNGAYRGAAHNVCNTKYHLPHEVPVIFHNFSKYDSHLFIRELTQLESDQNIQIIPSNTETYIAVTKSVELTRSPQAPPTKRQRTDNNNALTNDKKVFLKIIFKDSFRFLAASIDALAKSLNPQNDFKNLEKFFPANSDLLKRKGVFPYELIQSDDDYNIQTFPPKTAFATCLNDYKPISDNDYLFAKSVYNTFNCSNIGEYSDLYLKTDVCILADIFEKFRNECLDQALYGLDPVHYYTSPGLAWDAMLKITKIEIELLTELDKINFFKRGIRGGLSQCSLRKTIAKNKYTNPNEHIIDPIYLLYLDVNNLYGWAMSQRLPIGEYEWLDEKEFSDFDVTKLSENDEYGFVLEADIEYPIIAELHKRHNDLPFLTERIETKSSMKLMATLKNKDKYVAHGMILKQAIENGLKINKIHRILRFKQEAWMAKYIELNNEARKAATETTKKNLCKLMNNAVFGKTIENVEKRRTIRLFNTWENQPTGKRGAVSFISSGYLKKVTKFTENCVAIELQQKLIQFEKPIQIGFTILELAKYKIYDFHYEFMGKMYSDPDKVKLCYTDTDSFIYEIHTEDVYDDLKQFVINPTHDREVFDTSDYAIDNPYGFPRVNKKKLGAMKDECSGKIMTEFIGLRAKCYSYKVAGEEWHNKAKGVKRHVADQLESSGYESCLLDHQKIITKEQHIFRSKLHEIVTENVKKCALNGADDKRFICNDKINTYAWGHCDIDKEIAENLTDEDIEMMEMFICNNSQ